MEFYNHGAQRVKQQTFSRGKCLLRWRQTRCLRRRTSTFNRAAVSVVYFSLAAASRRPLGAAQPSVRFHAVSPQRVIQSRRPRIPTPTLRGNNQNCLIDPQDSVCACRTGSVSFVTGSRRGNTMKRPKPIWRDFRRSSLRGKPITTHLLLSLDPK